jgi:hypothetical protein
MPPRFSAWRAFAMRLSRRLAFPEPVPNVGHRVGTDHGLTLLGLNRTKWMLSASTRIALSLAESAHEIAGSRSRYLLHGALGIVGKKRI